METLDCIAFQNTITKADIAKIGIGKVWQQQNVEVTRITNKAMSRRKEMLDEDFGTQEDFAWPPVNLVH